jgi:hypothetical protein
VRRTASSGAEGLLSQRTESRSGAHALSLLPDKPAEHRRVIAFLAQESTASIDEVTRLYEHERAWGAFMLTRTRMESCG